MIAGWLSRMLRNGKPAAAYKSRPDDVYLVAYPKSGSTWLRFMLGNYLSGGKCDFTNAHLLMPDVHFNPAQVDRLADPRIIKSHYPFTPGYGRVIYLARDGRDVAVSYYFHHIKHHLVSADTCFGDFLRQFNTGSLDSYSAWGEHVNSWLDQHTGGLLLIRYEDLVADPVSVLKSVVKFVGLRCENKLIELSVERSSFKRMRELEEIQHNDFACLAGSRTDIRHVRRGQIGNWREHFDAETHQAFHQRHGEALSRLRYPLDF